MAMFNYYSDESLRHKEKQEAQAVKNHKLYEAARDNQVHRVRYLLSDGANVDYLEIDGEQTATALHVAAYVGHKAVVELLLAAGADIHQTMTDKSGPSMTAVGVASLMGHGAVVRTLLRAGASFNLKDQAPLQGRKLVIAAGDGNLAQAKDCLQQGADVDFLLREKEQQRTALHLAAFQGHVAVVHALIAAGADLELRFKGGALDSTTALHSAAPTPQVSVVDALLRAGADVNAKARGGLTPVHVAVGHNAAITQSLITAGADVNAVCQTDHMSLGVGAGWTALHFAAREGKKDVVDVLLRAGAKNIENEEGRTPSYLAVKHGHGSIAEALLLAGR